LFRKFNFKISVHVSVQVYIQELEEIPAYNHRTISFLNEKNVAHLGFNI
jgi:hypothetical protein